MRATLPQAATGNIVPTQPQNPSTRGGIDGQPWIETPADYIGQSFAFVFPGETSCPHGFTELPRIPTTPSGPTVVKVLNTRNQMVCMHTLTSSEVRAVAENSIIVSILKPSTTSCPAAFRATTDGTHCEANIDSQEYQDASGITPV